MVVGTPGLHQASVMSHHLDSPIARQDIRLDITDLYVFRGQTGTLFVINVCHSIPNGTVAPSPIARQMSCSR
jgi:hypothetical protein